MARLVAAKCPSCGANVRLDPARDVVSCTFCGATSFIQREGRPPPQHPPNTRVIMVPRSAGAGAGVVLALVGGMVALSVGVGVVFFASRAPSRSPPTRVQGPQAPAPGPKATPGKRGENVSVNTRRLPMLADATGDRAPDLVISFHYNTGSGVHYVYGAFDGRTGSPLWETEDLGSSIHQTAAAIDKDRLFVADAKGQLFAYGLRDGKKQWQTSLGDKGTGYCRAPEPDSVRVSTADKRVLVVDVRTGGQRPAADNTKTPCAVLYGHDRPTFSPEPTGYPDGRGPLGAEAWVCGGVRVMGDRNFTAPDSCGSRMKTSLPTAIPGMHLDFIVKEGEGWVLVGAKEPGTRTPMVGYFARGKLAWNTIVPDGNPLEARAGGPNRVAVAGGLVVVPYGLEARVARVAAFAIDSGRRVWDVALPKGVNSIDELVAGGDTVFAAGDNHIAALSLKDGSARFGVGDIR